MRRFEFRLESLLKYRGHRRDLLQSLYAGLLARKREMVGRQSELSQHRDRQLAEMRDFVAPGTVDIDAAANRRYHSARISADLLVQARDLEQMDRQLELCQRELIAAERDLSALENLKDRQRRTFEYEENRREQKELEDAWLSARSGTSVNHALTSSSNNE